jgi:hypothetical protein
MYWKEILKISTKDAISDAKRFAGEEVNEGMQKNILDEWRRMGLEVHKPSISSDERNRNYFIQVPNEPEGMFTGSDHFWFMEASPVNENFYVTIPKLPYYDASSKRTNYDDMIVTSSREAIKAGNLYIKRFDKAVKTYKEQS